MTKEIIATVRDDYSGWIGKDIPLHSKTFGVFQKLKKVKRIIYIGDSDWGDYYMGETYKNENGTWHYRYENKDNHLLLDAELEDSIVNLDIVAYYYHSVFWAKSLPKQLKEEGEDLFRTDKMSFVSSIEHFKQSLINTILCEYHSSSPNTTVKFIGKNATYLGVENLKDDDFDYIPCRLRGTLEYKVCNFYIESSSHIDRMKVYRLVSLLHNSGWNDEYDKFKNLLLINKGNLFLVSERNAFDGLQY